MNVRRASLVITLLVLSSTFYLTLTIIPENVEATTRYVGGSGPGNYTRIKDAITEASPGDIIYVYSGTYNEDISVYKELALIGEDRNTTIVQGSGTADTVLVTVDWVYFTGISVTNSGSRYAGLRLFFVQNCYVANNIFSGNANGVTFWQSDYNTVQNNMISGNGNGILFSGSVSQHNSVTDNTISENVAGIYMEQNDNNTFANNIITDNGYGIFMSSSSYNKFTGSVMAGNGIFLLGGSLAHWNSHIIDISNTINGKPFRYWKNITGGTIPQNTGGVILANCTNIFLDNLNLSDRSVSIEVGFSSYITITNNTASFNYHDGVYIYGSDNITLANNNVSNNGNVGISIHTTMNSRITNNTASLNGMNGLQMFASELIRIENNSIASNSLSVPGPVNRVEHCAVYISYSDHSLFSENSVLSNSNCGLSLVSSSLNTLSNNNISMNYGNGVTGGGGSGNRFIRNTILDNFVVGFDVGLSSHNIYISNNVTNHLFGINLYQSHDTTLIDNYISSYDTMSSRSGIVMLESSSNILRNNVMDGDGLVLRSGGLQHWNTHIIDTSNILNGRPVYYWKNVTGGTIPSGASEVILANCTDVIVENQDLTNGTAGIELGYSSNNTISNNSVSYSKMGIYLLGSNGNVVSGNAVSSPHSSSGIYLYVSDWNSLSDNELWGNRAGISLSLSDWNSLSDNELWDNGAGITLSVSDNNTIADNSARDNTIDAISLRYSSFYRLGNYNTTITKNTLINNGYGISIDKECNYNTVAYNSLLNNINGVHVRDSRNNKIHHNTLISNTQQAFDNGNANQWDDGYPSGGNYWSDYTGIDVNSGPDQDIPGSDGKGDTPYVIDGDSEDRYPLVIPPIIPPPRPPIILYANLTGPNSRDVTISWALSPDDGAGFQSVISYAIFRNSSYDPDGLGYSLLTPLPNRTTEYVHTFAGEGDPNNYFYQVCALDVNLNLTCSENQGGKFTRPLSPGPNLVSYPLIQSNDSVETVLRTVEWDKAWTYNSSTQKWKWYMKFKPYLGELERLSRTDGIWVNVTQLSSFTVAGIVPSSTTIVLKSGWNLVGFPSLQQDHTVGDLKAVVPAERMEGFDASAPPYFLRLMLDGDTLQNGYGYWVKVASDADWSVGDI